MNLLHCNRCGDLINTDDDPGAFVEIGIAVKHHNIYYGEWICERCREDGELEEEDE